MEYTLKQIKKELRNAIKIEEALLEMLAQDNVIYAEDDLKLLTAKLFEASGYILQLSRLIEEYVKQDEKRKRGDFDE